MLAVVQLFRRGKKIEGEPKNVNKYLTKESELKEMEIVKRDLEEPKNKRILLKRPQEKLMDIRKNTSQVLHRIVYFNPNIEDKVDHLKVLEKHGKFQRQLKGIDKKNKELNLITTDKKKKDK